MGKQSFPGGARGAGPNPRRVRMRLAIVVTIVCIVGVFFGIRDFMSIRALAATVSQAKQSGTTLPEWLPSPGMATLLFSLFFVGAAGGLGAALLIWLQKAAFGFVALAAGLLMTAVTIGLLVQFSAVPTDSGTSSTPAELLAGLAVSTAGVMGLIPKIKDRLDLNGGSTETQTQPLVQRSN